MRAVKFVVFIEPPPSTSREEQCVGTAVRKVVVLISSKIETELFARHKFAENLRGNTQNALRDAINLETDDMEG